MEIKSNRENYKADFFHIESLMEKIPSENIVFIIDKNIWKLYPAIKLLVDKAPCHVLDTGEENKTLKYAMDILLPFLIQNKATRASHVIAIGGGITQDLVGFICSIFSRGIPWIFIPTTLLAQADSCIGCKTSINHESYKNLLGTFYAPKQILIDTDFLKTLTDIDYRSGIGEIIKVYFMENRDESLELLEDMDNLLNRDEAIQKKYIQKSLSFKLKYVEKDEFDKDYRNVLNYGHCFGHALEGASQFRIAHGMAVTYGIDLANKISFAQNIMPEADYLLMERITQKNLKQQEIAYEISFDQILPYLKKDKKNVSSKLTFIQTKGFGLMEKKIGMPPELIETSWNELRRKL